MNAVILNEMDKITNLINTGADVNQQDAYGTPLLTFALAHKDFEIAKLLIDNGADVEEKDSYENSLLKQAVVDENFESAKFLIDNGADVNQKAKLKLKPHYYYSRLLIKI